MTRSQPFLGNCCYRTALNHMTIGTRTPRGVIRLRCQPMGGRRLTTRTWVAEYLAAIDAAFRPTPDIPRVETPEQQAERFRLAKARAAWVLGGREGQPPPGGVDDRRPKGKK